MATNGQNKPRMPAVPEITDPEQILPAVRAFVQRKSQRFLHEALGLEPGQRVLVVTDSTISPVLTEALEIAIRDHGGQMDVVTLEGYPQLTDPVEIVDTMFGRDWYPTWVWEGAKQADIILGLAFMKFPHVPGLPVNASSNTRVKPRVIQAELTPDMLLSGHLTYPVEVWAAIDAKSWELFGGARHIDITDADGTEFSFDLTPEDWRPRRGGEEGEVATRERLPYDQGHIDIPFPKDRQLEGVVALRSLTFGGPIPLTKLTIENRQVTKVEGGGAFGERLRHSFEEYRDVPFSNLPGPGCNWVSTFAFCTGPKYRRSPFFYKAQGSERVHAWCLGHKRSGFLHGSIGSALAAPNHKLIRHFDMMFPTMVADGRVVIQDGHLVALDDPEVRKVAERYGDPDELLREDWIPDREAAI